MLVIVVQAIHREVAGTRPQNHECVPSKIVISLRIQMGLKPKCCDTFPHYFANLNGFQTQKNLTPPLAIMLGVYDLCSYSNF